MVNYYHCELCHDKFIELHKYLTESQMPKDKQHIFKGGGIRAHLYYKHGIDLSKVRTITKLGLYFEEEKKTQEPTKLIATWAGSRV